MAGSLFRAPRLRQRLRAAALIAGLVLTIGLPQSALAAGSISASPALIDFGKVHLGATDVLYITVENTGDIDLELAGVGFTDTQPFSVDFPAGSCYTIVPLHPGDTCTIAITFSPTRAGRYTSTVQPEFHPAPSSIDFYYASVSAVGKGCRSGSGCT